MAHEVLDRAHLEAMLVRLVPGQTPEKALARLLLEEAQRRLIRYRKMDRDFRQKYQVPFETFRERMLEMALSFEEEQDYFDWEMAVTGIEEMLKAIEELGSFDLL
ncbi:MAG: hypothetical protein D6759_05125 [Chloroflexi bacterium]|nr:MAG: hypothetical protein D6759_05125 [Chloroflexota bacterium]